MFARIARRFKRRHHAAKLRDLIKNARAGDEGADMVARDAIMEAGYSPERAGTAFAQRPISDTVREGVRRVQEKKAARSAAAKRGAEKRRFESAPAGAHRKANDQIYDLIHNKYFESVPVSQIIGIVKRAGFSFDPEEESSMLVGRSGRATWDLFGPTGKQVNHMLVVQWHKMEHTGRFEIVAYVS